MRKFTQKQIDKIFINSARRIYDEFINNNIIIYSELFPENVNTKNFDSNKYFLVKKRLMFEFQLLYDEARGDKNVKKKCEDQNKRKRTVVN